MQDWVFRLGTSVNSTPMHFAAMTHRRIMAHISARKAPHSGKIIEYCLQIFDKNYLFFFNYKFDEKRTRKLKCDLKWDESGSLLYTNSARNHLADEKLFDIFELIYFSL